MKMGPIRCPETSIANYQSTPCNIPAEPEITHSSKDFCFHYNSHQVYGANHVVTADPNPPPPPKKKKMGGEAEHDCKKRI